MINRRLLTFFFALLLIFAQQQAMMHPYVHLADGQKNSASDKQTPAYSEACGQCIALAGIDSALESQIHAILVSPTQLEHFTETAQPLFSALYFPYHSRDPPALA